MAKHLPKLVTVRTTPSELKEICLHYLNTEKEPTPRHFRTTLGFNLARWHVFKTKYPKLWEILDDTQDIILGKIEQYNIYTAKGQNAQFILRAYDRKTYHIPTEINDSMELTRQGISIKVTNASQVKLSND